MLADLPSYTGQAAGLATSVLWTATSLLFTAAGRRIGPTAVNATRIAAAIVLLAVTHRLMAGAWIPRMVSGQVLFLALSGIVGLCIGDQALFTAFVSIGPRLAMLIMATAPLFAAFLGWLVLGETFHGVSWIGIVLTLGGVGWVILERDLDETVSSRRNRGRGVVLAFVGAACQAGGLLLSKQGMGHGWLPADRHLNPQAATLVRLCFAGLGMLPILAIYQFRHWGRQRAGFVAVPSGSRSAGVFFAMCGAVVGPYLGVWMSLVAADRAPVGIAQTLCSLPPVFVLPFVIVIYKEKVSPRAILGAVVAVTGTALLFLPPT